MSRRELTETEQFRVRIRIVDHATYAQGAAKNLDGLRGSAIAYSPNYSFGGIPAWLIEFDKPAKPWSTYQQPVTAFWFGEEDFVREA